VKILSSHQHVERFRNSNRHSGGRCFRVTFRHSEGDQIDFQTVEARLDTTSRRDAWGCRLLNLYSKRKLTG
jgi:hypothetical protein